MNTLPTSGQVLKIFSTVALPTNLKAKPTIFNLELEENTVYIKLCIPSGTSDEYRTAFVEVDDRRTNFGHWKCNF
jgi:hypothetical protein